MVRPDCADSHSKIPANDLVPIIQVALKEVHVESYRTAVTTGIQPGSRALVFGPGGLGFAGSFGREWGQNAAQACIFHINGQL